MISFSAQKILQTAKGKLLFDVSFELNTGEVLAVYGNSGAGKTTLLRILAGLTETQSAKIFVDGTCWDDSSKKVYLKPQKRAIGFVFQDFALFPNLTVKENIMFALSPNEDKQIVSELLEITGLQSLQNSKPQHISGGQKQRVALARAIARRPKLLLLDEPLSSLEDEIRVKLQDFLLEIHHRFKLTTLLVSHHLPEIFRLADKVLVIEDGKVKREGRPINVFNEEQIGSHFSTVGEVVAIEKSDIVYVISILSGNHLIKVIASEEEKNGLKLGTKVLIKSKIFNPIIQKLE